MGRCARRSRGCSRRCTRCGCSRWRCAGRAWSARRARSGARWTAWTRLIYEEIARRRAQTDLAQRTDILSLLLQARDEDGAGDDATRSCATSS